MGVRAVLVRLRARRPRHGRVPRAGTEPTSWPGGPAPERDRDDDDLTVWGEPIWLDLDVTAVDGIVAGANGEVGRHRVLAARRGVRRHHRHQRLATRPVRAARRAARPRPRPGRRAGLGARSTSSSRPRPAPTACLRSPTSSSTRRPTPASSGRPARLPPLIVMSHGGPTGAARPQLNLSVQFWTSRGLRRRRRELPRQHRLRPGLPRRARRPVGHRRRRRLHRRGPLPRRPTTASTATGWPSAAAAPAATRRCARSRSTTTSPPAPASTASPTSRRWPWTPTSSSRATSTASSARTPRPPRPLRRARRRSTTPTGWRRRCIILQGLEDEIVPPAQAEMMVDGAAGQGGALRLPPVRGRAARVPPGAEHPTGARGGAVLLQPDASGSSCAEPIEPVEIENL